MGGPRAQLGFGQGCLEAPLPSSCPGILPVPSPLQPAANLPHASSWNNKPCWGRSEKQEAFCTPEASICSDPWPAWREPHRWTPSLPIVSSPPSSLTTQPSCAVAASAFPGIAVKCAPPPSSPNPLLHQDLHRVSLNGPCVNTVSLSGAHAALHSGFPCVRVCVRVCVCVCVC